VLDVVPKARTADSQVFGDLAGFGADHNINPLIALIYGQL